LRIDGASRRRPGLEIGILKARWRIPRTRAGWPPTSGCATRRPRSWSPSTAMRRRPWPAPSEPRPGRDLSRHACLRGPRHAPEAELRFRALGQVQEPGAMGDDGQPRVAVDARPSIGNDVVPALKRSHIAARSFQLWKPAHTIGLYASEDRQLTDGSSRGGLSPPAHAAPGRGPLEGW